MTVRIEHGDCLEVTDLAVGLAVEHLVCSDLLLCGHRAFLADQNCPYDVAVEHAGRLVRVQVKATRHLRPVPNRLGSGPSYMWHVRRAGKKGTRQYGEKEFDVLALVAFDIQTIAYMPIKNIVYQVVHLRVPGAPKSHGNKRLNNIDEYPFNVAISELTDV